jgi:hypothetical protein
MIADTTTGEVLDEKTRRLAGHYYQVQRADYRHRQREAARQRSRLTREARDLLLAGSLVTLMGVLLWALARVPN